MLHSVAAWSAENRIVLGCQSVDQKSNETIAIPELLKKLELTGAIITMDAMGSKKDIAAQIVVGGGDYVLAIKDNHPTVHKAMSDHHRRATSVSSRDLTTSGSDRSKRWKWLESRAKAIKSIPKLAAKCFSLFSLHRLRWSKFIPEY